MNINSILYIVYVIFTQLKSHQQETKYNII